MSNRILELGVALPSVSPGDGRSDPVFMDDSELLQPQEPNPKSMAEGY